MPLVSNTTDVVRVLETSHPPVYYLPIGAFAPGALTPAAGASLCEFKGAASYLSPSRPAAVRPRPRLDVPNPWKGYEILRGRVALYPGRMDACTVAGKPVTPQEGDFYGGWITSWISGPFKGGPGTRGWSAPRLGPSRSPYAGRMPPAPLPSVSVIVPWRPAASRVPAFEFLRGWYAEHLPEFSVRALDTDDEVFVLSACRNRGIGAAALDEVVVVNDADTLPDPRRCAPRSRPPARADGCTCPTPSTAGWAPTATRSCARACPPRSASTTS